MLSKLGADPHPKSFAMKMDGTKSLRMGPLKHKEMLRECIEEMSRCAVSLSFL
jgi:hypothetical protein